MLRARGLKGMITGFLFFPRDLFFVGAAVSDVLLSAMAELAVQGGADLFLVAFFAGEAFCLVGFVPLLFEFFFAVHFTGVLVQPVFRGHFLRSFHSASFPLEICPYGIIIGR